MAGPGALCLQLTDRTAAQLQIKINAYLQEQTGATTTFLLILLESSKEAIAQVIGRKTLENPIRLSVLEPMIDVSLKKDGIFSMKHSDLESKIKTILSKEDNGKKNPIHLMPVKNTNDEVAVIVGLTDLNNDEDCKQKATDVITELFRYCLTLIVNTVYGEEETRLKKQYQRLLSVARRFFSELNDLDVLLQGVMAEARRLTSAERCSLFLLDQEHGDLVAKVFDGSDMLTSTNKQYPPTEVRIKRGQGIAGHVAETGRLLNIHEAYTHPLFYKGLDERTGFVTKNILCFPICDENSIVGVAQLCNKIGAKHFDACDEEVASAFSIYCGVSIMHSIVYKKISDAQARTKISNEMLMYHLKVCNDDVKKVLECHDRHKYNKLPDLHFNCRSLPVYDTPCYVLHMFESLNLSKRFQIRNDTLARFTLYTQRGYRDVPYHNWMHAFNVAHFAYASICTFGLLRDNYLTDLECLAYLVACLCHDLDHRGTNNSFEIREGSLLASLYSSEGSVMECHHLSQTMCILNTEGCNILEGLPQYDICLQLIRDCILSTDLANHFKQMNTYKEMLNNGFCKENPEHRLHLLTMLMTCADLSDQLKDWTSVKKVAAVVYTEFFRQGDVEKQRGVPPQEMMDRERAFIPDLQIKFLENICLPVYRLLEQLFPAAKSCVKVMEEHLRRWQAERETVNECYSFLKSPNFDPVKEQLFASHFFSESSHD